MTQIPAPERRKVNNTLTATSEPSLQLIDLNIRAGDRFLLRDTNVTIPGGKITVIVGGSGAGKSVLLGTLSGLLPRVGEVLQWDGNIETDSQSRIGIVFQQFALFDELSPTENVQFAIDHRVNLSTSPTQSSMQWLTELGVPSRTRVAGLSGGQKQRLAIARTLAADPKIVLYDEPTSGLDAANGRKVADLIRQTHNAHRQTSIIVTHDYETLLPIADQVLLLDSASKQLTPVPNSEWDQIPNRMKPVELEHAVSNPPTTIQKFRRAGDDFLRGTGSVVITAVKLPFDLLPLFPRPRWGMRFFLHYLRLVGGVSAWIYLILAGMIVGFTTTYFTLRFLPFRLYTQPLLIDELLSSIGFALYRILVPVLATILIAARCGAAVAADVGVKQYGGQVDALRTLGVQPKVYLLVPIVMAFVVATPLLEWLAFSASNLTSMVTFNATHGEIGPFFWNQHFFRKLIREDSIWPIGWRWVLAKNLVCGVGTGAIGYYLGISRKQSATDVSRAITSTVLWTTLFVLVVHFVVALLEF